MNRPRIRDIFYARQEDIQTLSAALSEDIALELRERILFRMSRVHRMIAISYLLTQVDMRAFQQHLRQSAETRQRLLLLPGRHQTPPGRFQSTGNVDPLFDAIVAGEEELALEMAHQSPETWQEGYEFEDDFYYGRFLHLLLQGGVDSIPARAVLAQWRNAFGQDDPPRLQICEALVSLDDARFEGGFQALLQLREAQFRAKEKESVFLRDPDRYWTERVICIEGLALIRLATRFGISPPPEYPCVPAIVRSL